MSTRERPLVIPNWLAAILVSVAVAEFIGFAKWAADMNGRLSRVEATLEFIAARDSQSRSVVGKR